jgi:predicted nuclease of predicted toxin-antitoxin system
VIARVRFHLDENVDPDIATALRRVGINVTATQEIEALARSDTIHWEYAQQESRVIVTHDADFLTIAAQQTTHAGLAYCSQQRRSMGEIIRRLVAMHDEHTPDDVRGVIFYL